jgi:hypothetical protein
MPKVLLSKYLKRPDLCRADELDPAHARCRDPLSSHPNSHEVRVVAQLEKFSVCIHLYLLKGRLIEEKPAEAKNLCAPAF